MTIAQGGNPYMVPSLSDLCMYLSTVGSTGCTPILGWLHSLQPFSKHTCDPKQMFLSIMSDWFTSSVHLETLQSLSTSNEPNLLNYHGSLIPC